jgi:Ca2+-binding RTX toxin-like protein
MTSRLVFRPFSGLFRPIPHAADAVTPPAANDANDRIIYEQSSGKLYYDADGSGSGAQIQIAVLGASSHPSLTATDFLIVA